MSAPRISPRDMEYVRRIVDGVEGSPFWKRDGSSLDTSDVPVDGYVATPAERQLRIELGQERFRADCLQDRLKAEASKREAMYAEWLDNACEDRDKAQRSATRWMLAAWALFLLLVVAIIWRLK